jgi:nucleoside-diphosphate-sugar epimerase
VNIRSQLSANVTSIAHGYRLEVHGEHRRTKREGIPMKVLVIGAAGGFGGTVARELLSRGHAVRALVRPGGRVPALDGATPVTGDALDPAALERAADDVDAIAWGFHLPYHLWVPGAVEAARITAELAARRALTVLFPGNVYGLGASASPMDERAPKRPRSKLGEIRNEIEGLFERAAVRGGRTIVVRAGDYLGPHTANTWLEMMSARAVSGGRIVDPGGRGIPHAWAYLPDVVRAGVDLLERRESLAPFDVFHFQGYDVDTTTMIDAIRSGLSDANRRTIGLPWWLIRAASPFSPLLKQLGTMRYLWEEPVLLDGSKLRRALPDLRVTPLDTAVTTTLRHLAAARGVALPHPALAPHATAA